ncbi:MAG: molybdopterin molybdotransferase MoeA [Proteobacteria bacterium]|nr:molybdopterin molybdotransferase MoeA [Pseudomonadota bacterium]MCH8236793.1 molybdopterin molybdotransferase MoeA [Pseudomonadota bacterium]
MAQLKDDCFAFGGELMPLADALKQLKARVGVVSGTETVTLRDAIGRILAEDLIASRDVPPLDNSAVDGYAVYFDDLEAAGETRLPVTGRIAAGHPLGRPAERGQAFRIFTGAPMPVGADGTQASGPDTIFMEEDCTPDGDNVVLPAGLKAGANRRGAGEDITKGSVIMVAGRRLRAQEVGLAASVGRSELTLFKRLRTAVFSTGDEVRDPGTDAPEGCIFDANRFAIIALLEGLGAQVTDLGILADDADTITGALEAAAADHDLLVTSGGVSAGEEDHVRDAIERLGQIHFWRLAIKPGRPIALGQVGDVAFLGLPGNPVAAMVTFMVIGRPLVLLLAGATDVESARFPVEAGFDYKKKKGRREWARVTLETNGKGVPVAMKHHSSGAGILTSMVEADGLVELPEDCESLKKGATVDFLPFSEVTG